MEVLSENKFESFKTLIKENRQLATLALKTKSVIPSRVILVKTDKWRSIIREEFSLSKNNKFYLRRIRVSELIFGKKMLYGKVRDNGRNHGKLITITPFNLACDSRLINTDEILKFYDIEFLKPYYKYFYGNLKISFIKKNKITNIEKLIKLKYPGIPYRFFTKRCVSENNFDSNLPLLNDILMQSSNPNVILSFDNRNVFMLLQNQTFLDLFNMSKSLDRKINLLWSNKRIKIEHDKLSLEIQTIKKHFVDNKDLSVNKRFHDILPKSYELITNTLRLFEEGESLRHCVYTSSSYLTNIQCGLCAIFSKLYKGERYTLELSYSYAAKLFQVNQFRGYRNKSVPNELYSQTKKLVDKINSKSDLDKHTENSPQVQYADMALDF